MGTTTHYDKYNNWSAGDNRLDWYGAEAGQGSYMGLTSEGTPLAWTSNVASSPGYQSLNTYKICFQLFISNNALTRKLRLVGEIITGWSNLIWIVLRTKKAGLK